MSGLWSRVTRSRQSRTVALAAAFGMAMLGIWQAYIVVFDIRPLMLPSPFAVAGFIAHKPGLFLGNAGPTLLSILTGFGVGTVAGLILGILMDRFAWFREGAYPWLVASQMVPVVAVAPILVLWFGFTLLPKMIVVALICFFPVAVNTVDGLRSIDPDMVRMMRTLGASPMKILRTVSIPSALPSVFSGLRVSIALSVVAAVFGEWVGSDRGLGYLMLTFNNNNNTTGLFASVAVLSLLGIILFFLVGVVERFVIPWHAKTGRISS